MNASRISRAYMAKNLDSKMFTRYVINCIRRELKDQGRLVRIDVVTHQNGTVEFSCYEGDQRYSFETSWPNIKKQQKKGLFDLDRMILEKLEQKGFTLDKECSDYVRTLFRYMNESEG
ncbi:MAG: hypothetical protein H0Z32_03470 [Bacillaceae bacterium]|nr:hypothetical protein [Bacillaceae bacterium]